MISNKASVIIEFKQQLGNLILFLHYYCFIKLNIVPEYSIVCNSNSQLCKQRALSKRAWKAIIQISKQLKLRFPGVRQRDPGQISDIC